MSAKRKNFGLGNWVAFLVLLFVGNAVFGQEYDHRISPAEQAAMPAYLQARTAAGITSPPVSPVRAPAEWEEIDALMITWTGQNAILREIVRHAQLESRVIILCQDSMGVQSHLTTNG
ncbi:MAG: hypothetical protein RLZZ519_2653, partial [Bacteroidota bacterium]